MKVLIVFILALNCGIPYIEGRGRIFNGSTAPDGTFTYQVRVIVPINATVNTYCGGSLLNNNTWVLTAAHCFDKGYKNATEVLFGMGGKKFKLLAKAIVINGNYVKATAQVGPINDIALIQIPKISIEFNPSGIIKSVNLALSQQNANIDGQSLVISGWGQTGLNSSAATQLQYTTLKVLSDSECSKRVRGVQLASQFCAFKSDSTACFGDSGGPAILQGSRTQLGVISYVMSLFCQAGSPVVISRISYFLPWIQKVIAL